MRNTETNIGHRLMQKACCSLMSLHHDMWELFDELKVRE